MKYEEWSLGYWFLKQYVRFADWLILKKTIITGRENIPAGKPIVFAPNHQNALSDPMAILLNTHFQPVWLARADIFGKHRIIDTVLKFLKIIPVYRLRDGKGNLDKNEETFSVSIKVLKNNFALALFPEAAHTFKRQMIPHQKAVPRIVFMAEEQTGNTLDIQIIPAGIYYSSYWKFNRTVIVNFGKPIPVKQYLETFGNNINNATLALKKDLYDATLPLVINIKSKKHYENFELIRNLYGEYFLLRQGKKVTTLNRFKSDQYLTGMLDEMEAANPLETEKIALMANEYYSFIRSLGLRNRVIAKKDSLLLNISANLVLLLAGFPIFVFGFLFNAIPFFIIDKFVKKNVKDKSFWSSFFLVGGIVVFPIYYLILTIFMISVFPTYILAAALIISLPFAGKLAFKWYILFRKTTGMIRFLNLMKFRKTACEDLLFQKKQFFERLDDLLPLQ